MDAMQQMLDAQKVFQASLKAFQPNRTWTDPQTGNEIDGTTMLLIDNAVMAMVEAAEIHDGLPWKKHKQEHGRPLTFAERDHIVEEAIDLLHFVVNILLLCGVDQSEEVWREFSSKNATNHARQQQGY